MLSKRNFATLLSIAIGLALLGNHFAEAAPRGHSDINDHDELTELDSPGLERRDIHPHHLSHSHMLSRKKFLPPPSLFHIVTNS